MGSYPNAHLRGLLLFNEGKSPRRCPPTADVLLPKFTGRMWGAQWLEGRGSLGGAMINM